LLGWYRIPLRSAPKVISVDYLAFYQTAAFGEDKWCIQYIAPVLGHELSTRLELLKDEVDHPRASQEYYKIQLGAIQRLPKPIPAESWRRITFLYTTGEYLLPAETINDLIVHTEDRQVLWQALRERACLSQEYHPRRDEVRFGRGCAGNSPGIREASTPLRPINPITATTRHKAKKTVLMSATDDYDFEKTPEQTPLNHLPQKNRLVLSQFGPIVVTNCAPASSTPPWCICFAPR